MLLPTERRIIAAGTIGNLLEWYDFAIYGYFAPSIGRVFFPSSDAVAQILAAFGIWARNAVAVWFGVFCASLNAIAQLLMLPAYPLWSLALFAIDILVIYGLVAYGTRQTA